MSACILQKHYTAYTSTCHTDLTLTKSGGQPTKPPHAPNCLIHDKLMRNKWVVPAKALIQTLIGREIGCPKVIAL